MNKSAVIGISLIMLFLLSQARELPKPARTHKTKSIITHKPVKLSANVDTTIDDLFRHPPQQAKPWVFWYWMQAAVSKEGITADLEAMKENGIGGAFMMFIKGPGTSPLIHPWYEQLTPGWWQMVQFAMQEAKRLDLQLAMHVSDGFALAGGPWITPELSMQKVVWTKTYVTGNQTVNAVLTRPLAKEKYYKDIAVYAFPTPIKSEMADTAMHPVVTSSLTNAAAPQYLAQKQTKQSFKSDSACWIQYAYEKPFTCRQVVIHANGNNYESHRLLVQSSNDGVQFTNVVHLESPRHGWEDNDEDNSYAIQPTTARYFRFVYNKEGSEPGAEDLDAAKWRPTLKITGIEVLGEPVIHQYEGKNGSVWRVGERTTSEQVPDSLCVPLNSIIDISDKMTPDGHLTWDVPAGDWTIIRIGHTSTGHTNATGGGGIGLECDKFNPDAVKLQFDKWFGEAIRQAGPDLAKEVLKIFHVDSWECGSQNWSPVFRAEFKKRRGYDCMPYIIAMTGVPVQSADQSERFLYDVRQTIVDLVNDNFYVTLKNLAHEKGCAFTAESIAPTMTSDGLLHYGQADIPMGEFWFRSPTHDKPNDMLDAISGGHIYGKPLIQAEAFTELRMAWDEHPGMLKTLEDRNYALGINRLVYHVFMHNPWMDRKPGMTLNGVGLFFQRNQTWWKPGKAWVDYAQRCQALLQLGKPVVDVAVFTGEEIPRRSILPYRLVTTLPGIFGDSVVQSEKKRLANVGTPLQTIPEGVVSSANMAEPEKWVDPLHGYAYDCFNPDVLLQATVNNGRVEFPGGASYQLLVLPQTQPMLPTKQVMTPQVAAKIAELVKAGATIIVNEAPDKSYSLQGFPNADQQVKTAAAEIWSHAGPAGKGKVVQGPYTEASFHPLGIEKDVEVMDAAGKPVTYFAWTHRTAPGFDIYFISNQLNEDRTIDLSLRVQGRLPEIWDPVSGEQRKAQVFDVKDGRTSLPVRFAPNGSLFIVLRQPVANTKPAKGAANWVETTTIDSVRNAWTVSFDTAFGGPAEPVKFEKLTSWSTQTDKKIRYYSGTASYTTTFAYKPQKKDRGNRIWLNVGQVADMATVYVNNKFCGTIWTAPFQVEITNALKSGSNDVRIEVTNTWANRLNGDLSLPEKERLTWTLAPPALKDKPLLPAGLLGPVTLVSGK